MSKKTLSCKACFAYGEKDVRVELRELEYDENDVLVKVERGGICGSDIHYYQHGRAGMSVLKHPMVVGHEFVGTVSQAPTGSALRVEVMAFAEPLAVAIHAVNVAGTLVGKRVLVIGAGPIGCLILAAARSAGASELVASDVSDRCLTLARQMGATATFNPLNEGSAAPYQENKGYFDVVFEASGSPAAIASTVALARPAGTVVQVGMGANSVDYPVMPMLVKEIRWVGSFRFVDEFTTAVKWLQDGRIDPLPLLSGEYPPEAIENALIAAADKNLSSKVQIRF